MHIDYVPVLAIHREIQALPRGMHRFRTYLRTILNERGDDAELLPLVAVNPMAREHVTAQLDELLAADADAILAAEVAAASADAPDLDFSTRASLVILDDAQGGWTNRWVCEHGLIAIDPGNRRFWIVVAQWSSEPVDLPALRVAARAAVHRVQHVLRRGRPRTLRDLLRQEGWALDRAGATGPTLDADELAYTRLVIEPHLDAEDMRTAVECLYGDAAARSLGFTPRGLSAWAGLALALADARQSASVAG